MRRARRRHRTSDAFVLFQRGGPPGRGGGSARPTTPRRPGGRIVPGRPGGLGPGRPGGLGPTGIGGLGGGRVGPPPEERIRGGSKVIESSGCQPTTPDPDLRTLAADGGGGYFELRPTDDLRQDLRTRRRRTAPPIPAGVPGAGPRRRDALASRSACDRPTTRCGRGRDISRGNERACWVPSAGCQERGGAGRLSRKMASVSFSPRAPAPGTQHPICRYFAGVVTRMLVASFVAPSL